MQTGIPEFKSGFLLKRISGRSRPDQCHQGCFIVVQLRHNAAIAGMEDKAENAVVFVVENSAEYMYQLEQAVRKSGVPVDLKIARYGNEAILYLKGVGIYADRSTYPIPRIILLDLDLPDGSALSVLGWIRQQADLFGVSVLATGFPSHQGVIQQAREMGALAWFPKMDFNGMISTVESLVGAENRQVLAT